MTLNLGLVGYPLDHSYSPKIHRLALMETGIMGEYRLYPCHPDTKDLSQLIDSMRKEVIQGLNVTIPYKQHVMFFLDDISGRARTIGAVNTIRINSGRVIGDNTDADGFWMDFLRFIDQSEMHSLEYEALVLGAGGSARAVCYSLHQHKVHLCIAARRYEQAAQLANSLALQGDGEGIKHIPLLDLETWLSQNKKPIIVINTTPLGMHPWNDQSPWPDKLAFPKETGVYDLVYNPSETRLMRQAVQHGCTVSNGFGMLVEQALLSFKMWSGKKVSSEKVLNKLRAMEKDQ